MTDKSYFLSDKEISIESRETFKRQRRPKYLKITALYPKHIYQADLFFYANKIFLCCVDVKTRYGLMIIASSKRASSILVAFETVIKRMGRCAVLMVDGGGEFLGTFKKYCSKNDIEIRIMKGDGGRDKSVKNSMGIVERLNRSFRQVIKIYLAENKKKIISITQKDIDLLNDNYNMREHSSFNPSTAPQTLFKENGVKEIVEKRYSYNLNNVKFGVGDKVRVLLQRPVMSKGSKDKRIYSLRVYEVVERVGNTFKLNDDKIYPYSRLYISSAELTKNKPVRSVQKVRRSDRIKKMKKIPVRRSKRRK